MMPHSSTVENILYRLQQGVLSGNKELMDASQPPHWNDISRYYGTSGVSRVWSPEEKPCQMTVLAAQIDALQNGGMQDPELLDSLRNILHGLQGWETFLAQQQVLLKSWLSSQIPKETKVHTQRVLWAWRIKVERARAQNGTRRATQHGSEIARGEVDRELQEETQRNYEKEIAVLEKEIQRAASMEAAAVQLRVEQTDALKAKLEALRSGQQVAALRHVALVMAGMMRGAKGVAVQSMRMAMVDEHRQAERELFEIAIEEMQEEMEEAEEDYLQRLRTQTQQLKELSALEISAELKAACAGAGEKEDLLMLMQHNGMAHKTAMGALEEAQAGELRRQGQAAGNGD